MELISFGARRDVLFLAATLCAVLFLVAKRFKRRGCNEETPPGPKGLPVIGNLHQVTFPLHKFMSGFAHKYGPVFMLRFGTMKVVVVSSQSTAKEFFKSHDTEFAGRPPFLIGKILMYDYSNVAMAPYGPKWRESRRICTVHLLTNKRVNSFSGLRRKEVSVMVDNLWRDSNEGTVAVNLSKALEEVTTCATWRIICGLDCLATGASFTKLATEINSIGKLVNIGEALPWLEWLDIQGVRRRLKRAHSVYDSFMENILTQRISSRNNPSSGYVADFLDILLDQACPRDTIKAIIFDVAVGGIETTTVTIDWAMCLVLRHPHVLLKIQQELDDVVRKDGLEEEHLDKLKYLKCVVLKTMRLHPPTPLGIPHYSMEDTNLCGYHVPKDTVLLLNIRAIGRDAAVWEDPDEFKPERFMVDEVVDLHGHNMKSIPFGSGRRGCPGAAMATTMIMITLAMLVYRFEWTVYGEIDMEEVHGMSAPRKTPMFVIPKLRHS